MKKNNATYYFSIRVFQRRCFCPNIANRCF